MKYSLLAAAVAAACCGTAAAEGPDFSFSGFGTVAAVHSSDRNSDFVSNIFQPNGAGHTSKWSLNTDSRLGGQIDVVFDSQWSAVVQVVAQHQYDNSFTPRVEWANLKYKITPEIAVRVGRIALPTFLTSESRFVGYTFPWVRPPAEVYSVWPITSNDGIDATWRRKVFGANNTLQAFFGATTSDTGPSTKADGVNWGLIESVDLGSLTLRAGYNHTKLDLTIPDLQGSLLTGIDSFAAGAGSVPLPAFQSVAAQARTLSAKYGLKSLEIASITVGAAYDPGDWFVMSELVSFRGHSYLSDSTSWYVSGGYRFGKFTPYATYANTKSRIRHEDAIVGAPPPLAAGAAGLVGGVNATTDAFAIDQHSVSAGLRWDFYKNIAAKVQLDRIHVGENSVGRFKTIPGLTAAKNVNLATVSLDFVF